MSTHPASKSGGALSSSDNVFGIDLVEASSAAITMIRVALGLAATTMLLLGIALTVWPGRTLVVGAALLGINLLVLGLVRIVIGIFSAAPSAGLRILEIVLGVLLMLGGTITLRNLDASTAALLLIATIAVGFGWIIDGIVTLAESGNAASRGIAIAFGAISILAGIAVVATPVWTAAVFVTFAAVLLMVFGVVGLIRAFTFGKTARA
jgi:uncharacterized membrane protein HdeD (DUF308 family)